MDLLNQLGGLLLGAVPTMVFFLLLVVAYGFLVRRPMDKVLVERRLRTTGAIEQARSAIGSAEAETAVFEDKLRTAKREIFEAREQRQKQWNAERDAALNEAKAITAEKIKMARGGIDQGVAAAKTQIETMSGELSQQILRAVLPGGVAGTEAAQ